ncbi:hypothetical protein B0A52_09922 [Exophiala mesophila]|uniref:Major facilitator superfamily (MFS) profile domain-containing protein n=1 Tax=Exophiala mesophila TaxID=212818 RepID=A0A438MQS6_EXOME|nr:hypothetical protein B0A52_09922 [Exophiala mesophila]
MVEKNKGIIAAFNGRLTFTVFVLMLSQVNFGLDLSTYNTTQAMASFTKKFGVFNPVTGRYAIEPYFLSLLNSLTYVGQVAGVILGGWLGRHYGRRMSFFVMCFWAVLSAILLVTAQTKEQMLVARILNYIYIGQELATVPVMQSEIVPAHVRGFVVGTYQLGIMLGSFLAALITYGTNKIQGEASFRIPLGLFMVIPVIVFFSVFFMPESPRWYLVRDRQEEALAALRKYREGRFTEEEIMEEYATQVAMINMTTQDRGTFREMLQGTNLRRTLIVVGTNFCIQITGQAFASKYGAIFLKEIGALDPFAMSCINTAIFIVLTVASMLLIDRVGRRFILLTGSIVQASSFLTMGGLGTIAAPDRPVLVGISAMLTIFYSGFSFGWAPAYHIITSEIPNSRMRDVTYTVASTVNVVTQFVVAFTIPYLWYEPYAALGPKVGFIFGSFCVGTTLFIYFFIPECRKLSLEEIDHLFMEKTPTRKFRRYRHGEVLPPSVTDIVASKQETGPTVEQREFKD